MSPITTPPKGPWKEGREGALSLCYVAPPPALLETALRHHAAVGIRATVVCAETDPALGVAADRNWDLAAGVEDPDLLTALSLLDGRSERGCFLSTEPPADPIGFLYRLSSKSGDIEAPGPDLSRPLPTRPAPADADALIQLGKAALKSGHWTILRIDAACLDALDESVHRRFLQWLGDHHDRIWCAPVRDIGLWS